MMVGAVRSVYLGAAGGSGIHGTLGTVRSVSTTPTNAGATNFSTQQKEATLSSGREVMVIGDTTTTAQFWWSDDDWATKTDYLANVGGWSNGSIGVYTDSGGTQRLVAVWKQSGVSGTGPTGGARTSGVIYGAIGTLNAGATTITWGAAVDIVSAQTAFDYPSLATHAEGTGGYAHVVTAYLSGQICTYFPMSINSGGVGTAIGQTNIIAGTAGVTECYPSVCVDPTTKRIHVSSSRGATGVGSGIAYITAGYSAGPTWTFGSVVSVDTTRFVQSATRFAICRWNSHDTMAVIGGFLYDGTNNDLVQYEIASPYTAVTTTRVLSNDVSAGNSVFEGDMTVFAATGDTFYAGRNGAQSDIAYYWWVRSTTTLGARSVIQSANVTSPYIHAWPRSYKVGFLWTALNSSPYTVKAVALT